MNGRECMRSQRRIKTEAASMKKKSSSISLRLPVLVYTAVVSFLAASAAGFAWRSPGAPTGRALVLAGSLLIYLSDSLIARNLFRAPLPRSDLYVLPPYYVGQICIVLALYLL